MVLLCVVRWWCNTEFSLAFSLLFRLHYPRLALKIFITRNICGTLCPMFIIPLFCFVFELRTEIKTHTAKEMGEREGAKLSFQFQPFILVMSKAYKCLAPLDCVHVYVLLSFFVCGLVSHFPFIFSFLQMATDSHFLFRI